MSVANLLAGPLSRGLKRRGSDDEEESQESKAKKAAYSWYVTLESESSQPSDEDDESIYSVQDKETDCVRDTSDTSTQSWVSNESGNTLHVEYEVDSLSEHENTFPNNISSSDPDDLVTVGVLAAFCDSDLGLADDSEDSRSSVDSEIGRADYWTCVQCNTNNNNPLFRYCEKCYQACWQCGKQKRHGCFSLCENCFKIRKNFFPPRPKRRRHRFRKESTNSKPNQVPRVKGKEELTHMDSGLGSSQESKRSFTLDLHPEKVSNSGQSETLTPSSSSKESIDSGFPTISSEFELDFITHSAVSEKRTREKIELTSDLESLSRESKVKAYVDEVNDNKLPLFNKITRECNVLNTADDIDAGGKHAMGTELNSESNNVNKKTWMRTDVDKIEKASVDNNKLSPFCKVSRQRDVVNKTLDVTTDVGCRKRTRDELDVESDKIDGNELNLLPKAKKARLETEPDDNSCFTCTVAPKNGAFIHGDIAHICCCYHCAIKVWRTTKRCPMCNYRVTKVVKTYYF